MTVLEFAATEYGRTGKVIASEDEATLGLLGSTSALVKVDLIGRTLFANLFATSL